MPIVRPDSDGSISISSQFCSSTRPSRPAIFHNLSALNGRMGDMTRARTLTACTHTWSVAAQRAKSVFRVFQGAWSLKYRLERFPRAISSRTARLTWKVSKHSPIRAGAPETVDSISWSSGEKVPGSGITPSKYRLMKVSVRFTKFPNISASSLLLRAWKSFQVKSASFVSGEIDARQYRMGSGGKTARYSSSQIAQFRLVDNFCPSMLRNSLAGISDGRTKSPCSMIMAGHRIA